MAKMLPILSTNRRQAPKGAKVGALLPLISCAIGAALCPCDAAFAESTPYVLSGYFAVGGTAGSYNGSYDAGPWRGKSISGALQIELPSGLSLQATGRIADYALGSSISAPVWDTDNQNMLSAAAFWRDPSLGLIGANIETGGIKAWYDHRFNSIGVFGETYLNSISTVGANMTFTNSISGVNTYISSNDQTYEVWGEYFFTDDAAVRVSAAHQTSQHDFISDWHENIIGITGEYFIKNVSGMDASVTAAYFHSNYSDSDRESDDQLRVGMKWYFGGPRTLLEAKRKGAVETRYNNYVDVPRWWQFPL